MMTLTDLEETLTNDSHGYHRRELLDQLNAEYLRLALEVQKPQSADIYARLERQRQSCLAAMNVVTTIWLRWQG